jgi:hypothetical protein
VVIFVPAPDELFAVDDLPGVPEDFVLFADTPVLLLFGDVPPLFEEALVLLLFDEPLPAELLAFDVVPPLLAFEEAPPTLLDLDNLPALSVPFVPVFPEVLAFDEELFPPLINISLTVPAAIFKAPAAAPCAALVRISPAASLTLSMMPGVDLFLVLFDFADVDFLVVDFLVSFFAAMIVSSLAFIIKT